MDKQTSAIVNPSHARLRSGCDESGTMRIRQAKGNEAGRGEPFGLAQRGPDLVLVHFRQPSARHGLGEQSLRQHRHHGHSARGGHGQAWAGVPSVEPDVVAGHPRQGRPDHVPERVPGPGRDSTREHSHPALPHGPAVV